MSIVSLAEALNFLDITAGYFEIVAVNNTMNFTSSEGGPSDITLSDGSYSGSDMATELQTKMNANTTLTGSGPAITFTVSYNSTTSKFTINADTGNTIAYDHSESNAGLTLGFNDDASASQTITSNQAASDPTAIIETLRDAIEDYVQNVYCKRTFESTAYTLERYDWKGYQPINLNNFPITILDRVVLGTLDAIGIKNTNTYTSASVSVSSTGLRLVYNGSLVTGDFTFATNTTLTAMVAAVSTSSGWTAQLQNSAYGSIPSSFLIDRFAASVINNNWVYLEIPDIDAEDEVEVYADRGQIVLNKYYSNSEFTPSGYPNPGGYPRLRRYVFIDYTAGYSSSNMPEDLKLAINILISYFYRKQQGSTFGIKDCTVGKISSVFSENSIPKEASNILGFYKRRMI